MNEVFTKERKKKIIGMIITFLFMITAIPIVVKIFVSFVESKFDFSLLNKESIKNIVVSSSTYKEFYNFKIENPVKGVGYIALGWYVLASIFRLMGGFTPKSKFEQAEGYGSHGTSRFQTDKEIVNNYYDDKVGWFLGSNKLENYKVGLNGAYHKVNGKLNMQMVVVGPPGSNKTTGFVLPNIFHLCKVYKDKNERIREYSRIFEANKNTKGIKILHFKRKYKDVSKKYRRSEAELSNKKGIEKLKAFIKNEKENIKNWVGSKYKLLEPIDEEMPDMIITDPKSELYSLTSDYLKNNGYDVRVLDFIHLKYGDKLNPLDFIKEDKDIMEVAKGYIDSVEYANGGGKASGDSAFWNEQEAQVLAALIGFVKQKFPDYKLKQTFTEISKILTSEDVADIDSASVFFKHNEIKGAPLQLWNNFLMIADSDRTRANILGGLATKLKLFAIDGVQNITNTTTIDLQLLGRKKDKPIALFIFMPDGDRTFSPIINVAISTIFKTLYKTAYKTRNKLESPVYFILEEMANIGKIPNIQEMLGTMRGRRIYPMMIWQSLSQMKDRYSDAFEDIMSQCDTKVYLGVNDDFTANYCSKSLGMTTIKVQNTSKKADEDLFRVNEKNESNSYSQRALMMPDEVMRMDNDLLIMVQRANNPSLLYKTQYKYWEYKICNEVAIDSIETIKNESNNIEDEAEKEISVEMPERDIEKNDIEKDVINNKEIEEANNEDEEIEKDNDNEEVEEEDIYSDIEIDLDI